MIRFDPVTFVFAACIWLLSLAAVIRLAGAGRKLWSAPEGGLK